MFLSAQQKRIRDFLLFFGLVFLFLNFGYVVARLEYAFSSKDTVSDPRVSSGDLGIDLDANMLRIPKIHVSAPIVYVAEKSERVYQEALRHGVVHYPQTAQPGEVGNVFLFGHSSDLLWLRSPYRHVFANLTVLTSGDLIHLSNPSGDIFTYRVIETKVVGAKDLSVLEQPPNEKRATLQTSWPLGTALKRFVVIAELEE